VKAELEQFASIGWEAMDETDREHRLKWVCVLSSHPGKFMMRMRMPNGIVTSNQMRAGRSSATAMMATQTLPPARISSGVRIEDVPDIFKRFQTVGYCPVRYGQRPQLTIQ